MMMWLDALRQDLRLALRTLLRRPGFALAVVVTLGIGIGAATAVFSVIDGVLLERLPVHDQDRVAVAWKEARGFDHVPYSYAAFVELRDRLGGAERVAAVPNWGASRTVARIGDDAVPLAFATVSGELFPLLGTVPHLGRLLETQDDHVGAAPVVVLGHAAWLRLFGGEPHALGRMVRIADRSYTVIGVLPPGFDYPRATDAWIPLVPFWTEPPGGHPLSTTRGSFLDLVVRLRTGVSAARLQAELQSLQQGMPGESATLGEQVVRVTMLGDVAYGDVRPALLFLGAAVLLVLVVAGVNVASLLLARGLARRRELAVRAAIGAGRGRILRQLATEALVLAAAGCALGIIIALAGLPALLALAPPELPRLANVAVDARALLFAIAAASLVAALAGLLPALGATHAVDAAALRAGAATGRGARGHWLRQALVVAQVALATLGLATAGVLLRSLDRLQSLDLGFAPADLTLVEVQLESARYPTPALLQRGMMRLAEHAAALPGVHAATVLAAAPFAGSGGVDIILFGEGQTVEQAEANPFFNYEGADGSHFDALGLPIVRGRAITAADDSSAARVVVLNEAAAAQLWPGLDPVGRRLKFGRADSPDDWRTVVGIAADTRYRELTEVRPTIHVPYRQGIPVTPSRLLIRAALDPDAVFRALQPLLAELEPGASVVGRTPLPRLLAQPLARPRFQSALVSLFAAVALVLCAIGVYGVLAFLVRERTREIGIRMALGARPADVRALVLRRGAIIALAGLAIGLAAAAAAGRIVDALLYDARAGDPAVLAVTALVLLAAIAAAALLPTRAAARTDPLLVMRSD